jgi:hypothetical protein
VSCFAGNERRGFVSDFLCRLRAIAVSIAVLTACPAPAQTFISPPDFSSPPTLPGDSQVGLPLPGATQAELRSAMIWNLRAAMNVAALQCQFSPTLMTVANYNQLLRNANRELASAHDSLTAYFNRTAGKGKAGATAFDVYTTRTYNGFSTLYGQLGFCDTAAKGGRDAIGRPKGELYKAAADWLGPIRKSLLPAGDLIFAVGYSLIPIQALADPCVTSKGKVIKNCSAITERSSPTETALAN